MTLERKSGKSIKCKSSYVQNVNADVSTQSFDCTFDIKNSFACQDMTPVTSFITI